MWGFRNFMYIYNIFLGVKWLSVYVVFICIYIDDEGYDWFNL